jgi:hypothetical protein
VSEQAESLINISLPEGSVEVVPWRALASGKLPKSQTMRRLFLLPVLRKSVVMFIVAACLMGCTNKTKVDVMRDMTADIKTRPAVVYVTDFDLDADKIKLDPRRAREERGLGLLKEARHSLGLSKTPQEEAKELVDLMADSIVERLAKAGLEARRITSGVPLGQEGWLVRGSFLQVDEGNRLRRAVAGTGQTDVQVAVTVDDLAVNRKPAPLLQLDTDTNATSKDDKGSNAKSADSKGMKLPGVKGGKTLAMGRMNLYSIAVKYVLAGYDLDRNAKETGAKIAEEVVKRVKGIKPAAPSLGH